MNLSVSLASGEPIYAQIKEQIKKQILSGQLREGEPLPSIRNLAHDLQISVITTKRAYDELEQEGLVVSVAGKGTFVSEKNKESIREVKYRQLEEGIRRIVAESKALGVRKEELASLIELFYGEERE
ncbi:GntR family transcriptional regulator [Paenibacillus hemerocallicola]|jgi:GntR family transcriptional regulator|uniref:GntR family transcriptional regulator n=1 Tax=Paenibacillus hemerocallicola TaxID=1172614 RepID=A0A5C4TBD2_9BACL|nr:GntR family transcriptional regulator [Paenibacillus hemerocallicola]TNJ66384.1 GntR family transcriptional regulator [Paenibacillus hemerocallicola]